jgi:hypothetical protein
MHATIASLPGPTTGVAPTTGVKPTVPFGDRLIDRSRAIATIGRASVTLAPGCATTRLASPILD